MTVSSVTGISVTDVSTTDVTASDVSRTAASSIDVSVNHATTTITDAFMTGVSSTEAIDSLNALLKEIHRLGEEAILCDAHDNVEGMFASLEARDQLCEKLNAADVECCRSLCQANDQDLAAKATHILESIATLLGQNDRLTQLVTHRRDQAATQIRLLQQANQAQRSASVRWSDVGGHIFDQTR